MARPKTGKKKKNMTLTVDDQTRLELAFISQHHGESISALLSAWVHKEAKRIAKETGKEIPNADQLTLEELEEN